MDCHEDGWHLLLSWLKSSKKDGYDPEPFSIYYEKSTHEKYIDYWKRFFCYCIPLMDGEDRHGMELTDGQLRGLRQVRVAAVWPNTVSESTLDARVLDLSILFVKRSDYDKTPSAFLHFTAVLGIDA